MPPTAAAVAAALSGAVPAARVCAVDADPEEVPLQEWRGPRVRSRLRLQSCQAVVQLLRWSLMPAALALPVAATRQWLSLGLHSQHPLSSHCPPHCLNQLHPSQRTSAPGAAAAAPPAAAPSTHSYPPSSRLAPPTSKDTSTRDSRPSTSSSPCSRFTTWRSARFFFPFRWRSRALQAAGNQAGAGRPGVVGGGRSAGGGSCKRNREEAAHLPIWLSIRMVASPLHAALTL